MHICHLFGPDFTICAYSTYICILLLRLHLCVALLFMEISHFKDLGDTSVVSECSLGVNLVIDNLFDVVLDISFLSKI